MPRRLRHRFPALTALPIALLAAALLIPGAASAAGIARASVGAARSLGKPSSCAKRLPRTKAARMSSERRRRTLRRVRSCRRHLATESSSPASSLYWGAWIGDQLTGTEAPWDMGAVSKFEQSVGKQLSMVHFAAPFADCSSSPCSFYKFPTGSMEGIRSHGAIPFFSWSSQSTPSNINEPDFQLSDVIGGRYDDYIRGFAEAAKSWGHPFFLRFDWEMNGNWFPWSEGANGNQPGEYVAAWRHVHDIFTSVGATNVSWVWCPNVDPGREFGDIAAMYPGDGYVDWTSLDGYNWGTNPVRPARWMTFDQLFSSTYHRIVETIAPAKPMVIGEVGSTEYGGSKAKWIEEMLRDLPTEYPAIHGLLWFDKFVPGENMDWQLDSSADATSAFAAGIQRPSYVGNQYASLGSGPVPAPS
ncbi:MAG TPA: glycosyl hydrolase [Solirubrobacterales bacterium]|nr:glycosyl hydrolase [Solirubrobacterales bacterium]